MVWEPWRGASWGALPASEPGSEELSWARESMAVLAESTLSRGRNRPAVEPDRWGVDDPDLKPVSSVMSSGDDRKGKVCEQAGAVTHDTPKVSRE